MNSSTDTNTANNGLMHKAYKMQNFLKLLHTAPAQQEIQVNKDAGDSQYLPISLIEMRLDEFFFGHWEILDFEYGFQGSNLHGQLTLRMLHPISKIWINRVGVAATSLKTDEHQSNELAMALPLLKTECLKNATRTIGKAFGRDLNRDAEANYTPLLKPKEGEIETDVFKEFKSIIDTCETPGRLRDAIKTQLEILKRKGKTPTTINACKRYASDKYKQLTNGTLVI